MSGRGKPAATAEPQHAPQTPNCNLVPKPQERAVNTATETCLLSTSCLTLHLAVEHWWHTNCWSEKALVKIKLKVLHYGGRKSPSSLQRALHSCLAYSVSMVHDYKVHVYPSGGFRFPSRQNLWLNFSEMSNTGMLTHDISRYSVRCTGRQKVYTSKSWGLLKLSSYDRQKYLHKWKRFTDQIWVTNTRTST